MTQLQKPFFINSNFCYTPEECSTLPIFMNTVGQNTGNAYIAYAIYKILFGRPVPLPEIKNLWTWDFQNEDELVEQINRHNSHVLISLQDQIRLNLSYGIKPDWARINHFLTQLKKPFVVFSLGANAFPGDSPDWYTRLQPDFIRFLHILSEHSTSMSIRGEETAAILNKLGITNVEPVGCPTFFETGPKHQVVKRKVHLNDPVLGLTCKSYVLQDEQEQIALSYFPKETVTKHSDTTNLSLSDLSACGLGYRPCFAGIESWKKFVSSFVFSCFSRMHGGILSLNTGIPILITNDDLRSREMCNLFAIPYQPGTEITAENWIKLYEQIDIDTLNRRYPLLYRHFMDWLTRQGIDASILSAWHDWAAQLPTWQEPTLPFNFPYQAYLFDKLQNMDFILKTRDLRRLILRKIKSQWNKNYHCLLGRKNNK